MIFSEKLVEARKLAGLTQQSLGDLVGVSPRTIYSYELLGKKPRQSTLRRLADALQVSESYLISDEIDDPLDGMERKEYVDAARERFGGKAAREMDFLLKRNAALFAGGKASREAKDAFYAAITEAYLACKGNAKKTYGRKKKI
jgi:transcriptional regulator with XRE-family HTH domain